MRAWAAWAPSRTTANPGRSTPTAVAWAPSPGASDARGLAARSGSADNAATHPHRIARREVGSCMPMRRGAACRTGPGPPAPRMNTHDIVIAGGGIAGLHCARRLADAGHQILILEA